VLKNFHGGPFVIVVEKTGNEASSIRASSVDPKVLEVFGIAQHPDIVNVDGEADSGVQSGTSASTSEANLTQKGDTNSPAAEVAFLGGSSYGVLDHQDDKDEEEAADHLDNESAHGTLRGTDGQVIVAVSGGLKNGDSAFFSVNFPLPHAD